MGGVYIKNMQKPKKGEVIAFDGENAVYTDDNMKVHKCPLIEIDLVRCGECKYWHKNRKEGDDIPVHDACYDFTVDDFCSYGERRSDEKQSKDN